jgi:hypothetical protein
MSANPKPKDAVYDVDAWRPVMNAHPHRPETIDFLEMQRRGNGSAFKSAKARSASVRMISGRQRYDFQKSGAA